MAFRNDFVSRFGVRFDDSSLYIVQIWCDERKLLGAQQIQFTIQRKCGRCGWDPSGFRDSCT
jgi:hypothetical protein